MNYAIGIDLGGTRIKALSISEDGQLLSERVDATEDSGDGAWVVRIQQTVEMITKAQGTAPAAIGLAAPGLVERDGRSMAWMQGRLEGIQGLDWTEKLGRTEPVWVINDAHAALLGEVWRGAAKGIENVALLTLGTGVGGAVICDGRLQRGHLGRAGHLGHVCLDPDGAQDIVGTPGSLEDAMGECTLDRRSGGLYTNTADLVRDYEQGDTAASEIWLRSVYCLACGIVSIINAVDPQIMVLGGGIVGAGKSLFEPLETYLSKIEWRPQGWKVEIVPAILGDLAGAYGAAYHAMEQRNRK